MHSQAKKHTSNDSSYPIPALFLIVLIFVEGNKLQKMFIKFIKFHIGLHKMNAIVLK